MDAARDLLKTLYAMAMMVEARDAYTGGHLWRVSRFSLLLAEDIGLPDAEVQRVALGGFLHDLGKVGVPDAILNKPGPLTDEEYAVIRTHPGIGADLLAGHPLAELALDAVLQHHETPDGRGYPQGLSGEAIPLAARIVGITDAFDAMTSSRPYRAGMPVSDALAIIKDRLGVQFDRALGERFLALGHAGRLHHVVGHSEPGIPLQRCAGCGPIVVVPRHAADGDTVLCPACCGEYRVARFDGQFAIHPTGERRPVDARRPRADPQLIDELVAAAEPLLHVQGGLLARWFGGRAAGH